jgi:hypothetical protein
MTNEATSFEDFIFEAHHLTKSMINLIQEAYNSYNKKDLLRMVDAIRIAVRDLELRYQFKNKHRQKKYKLILKHLKSGCDKLEQAIMTGDILLIF